MADYRDKIKKLLALADSSNEHEAKAALLKAKQLMVEHKLTEMDLDIKKDANVIEVQSGVVYTKKGEWWIGGLALIIAENYCCKCFTRSDRQKKEISFFGMEEDAELCNTVFNYAVESARRIARQELVNNKYQNIMTAKEKTIFKNSICLGFCEGVRVAFDRQKLANECFGLIVVIKKEVEDEYRKLNTRRDNYKGKSKQIDPNARNTGFEEGKNFSINKVLA